MPGVSKPDRSVPAPVRRALRESAESVAGWRRLRGLTQQQLAERAGVGRPVITRLENGEGGVSLENVLRIWRALGILEQFTKAVDPYETDLGRMRADEELPKRVRHKRVSDG